MATRPPSSPMRRWYSRRCWRPAETAPRFALAGRRLPATLAVVASLLTAAQGILSVPPTSFVEMGFSEEPSDSAVAENAPVVLHCAAFATPNVGYPQIRWHKDGVPVELDEKRHRLHANGSLYINSVQRRADDTDEGVYHCLASLPGVGTIISRPARLDITYSIPTFEEQPRNVTLHAGQTAFFACSVSQARSARPARVAWLRNGAPLRLDPLKMVQLPSGALEIDALAPPDDGQYQCQVTVADKVRLSGVGVLRVIPGPPAAAIAPVFIAQPSQVRAVKGDSVTLDCAANGHPRPHISWLKDGASIDMSNLDSRFRVVGVGSLQIENVQPQDAGSYMCRAENREDSLDASATLTVLVPPTFRSRPAPQAVQEKEDALFECDVFGVPKPRVAWFKNGEPVLYTGYFQLVNEHDLRILGSVHNDRGIYQCVADNLAGTGQASAQLIVLDKGTGRTGSAKEAPSAPRSLAARVVTANIISLSWQPPARNADDIVAYSVFYKAEGSVRERVQNTTQHKRDEVIVKNLKPSTRYAFRVVAVDAAHGAGESSEPIVVETNADRVADDAIGPPLNVRATAVSSGAIAVAWDPPAALPSRARILHYEVFYQETTTASDGAVSAVGGAGATGGGSAGGESEGAGAGVGVDGFEERKVTSRSTSVTLDHLATFAEYTVWVNAVTTNGSGVSSAEVVARTFSDVPSETPQNVTLESAAGGGSLVVRWEPPPRDQQNGIITGYKIRYKLRGRKSDIITTDGNRRSYTIENLIKGETYHVKIAALTVNGTGPATEWLSTDAYRTDLEEGNVPGQPSNLRARPSSRSITVGWLPPRDTNIMIRGYRVGWGPGIPDLHTYTLEGRQRIFTIENLQPMTEYVISVRAYNRVGEGQSLQDTVRTLPESQMPAQATLVPPVGLKAMVLSPTTVVLFWSDTTLPSGQSIPGNRQYQVRYKAVSSSKYRYANSTQLNCMLDDLKPFTQYEFSVKVMLRARRESAYSMAVLNTTQEAAPESEPRDFIVDSEDIDTGTVTLHWGPPKLSNGIITGYAIFYTNEPTLKDRDWLVETVSGDKLTAPITGLNPDSTYFFKIQAKNSKGYGPFSEDVTHHTGKSSSFPTTILRPNSAFEALLSSNLLILIATGVLLVIFLLVGVVCALACRRRDVSPGTQSNRKDKTQTKILAGTTSLGDEKPPDLWIHHEQMELKNCRKNEHHHIPDSVTSNRNSQDVSSIEDHYMGTLDKKKSLYMDSGASDGGSSCRTDRPLLLLPTYPSSSSCSAHSRPTSVDPALRPLLYSSPSLEPGSSATLGRQYQQRASNQYSTGPRAHIVMDPLPQHIDGLTTLSRHHPMSSSTYESVVTPLTGAMGTMTGSHHHHHHHHHSASNQHHGGSSQTSGRSSAVVAVGGASVAGSGGGGSGGGQVPSYTSALLAANAAAAASLASQQQQQQQQQQASAGPPSHIIGAYDTITRQQQQQQQRAAAAGGTVGGGGTTSSNGPMRSFSVSSAAAGTGSLYGGPSTPPPHKHVVVRPQPLAATAAAIGAIAHAATASPQKATNGSTPVSGHSHSLKRVLVTPNGAPVGLRSTDADLATPFNEELDQQMANLEGLMKDLNGVISSNEFEC